MCFLFLQLMCYVCFAKHSQFSGNTVIGMPHFATVCHCNWYVIGFLCCPVSFTTGAFMALLFLRFNCEPFCSCVHALNRCFSSTLAFMIQRMSVGAKQSFTELYASSQRAVCFPILLKVSDVRPNVGWGRASRYLYTSCCRGLQARSRKRYVIHANPSYPSTHPWIFLHCAPSV